MKPYNGKDLNNLLGFKAKIILTGSVLFSVSKDFIKKISDKAIKNLSNVNNFNLGNKLDNYVEQSTKDELLEQKIDNIENTQDALADTYHNVNAGNVFNKSYYLKNISDLYMRLENKKVSYAENGLNRYSLAKLVFMQFKKNSINTFSNLKETAIQKKDEVIDKIADVKEEVSAKVSDIKEDVVAKVNDIKPTRVEDNKTVEFEKVEVNENTMMEDTYSQILNTLKQSIDCRSKLEQYRMQNPRIYKQVMEDLTSVYDKRTVDDDFIEEVGPRSSSR